MVIVCTRPPLAETEANARACLSIALATPAPHRHVWRTSTPVSRAETKSATTHNPKQATTAPAVAPSKSTTNHSRVSPAAQPAVPATT